jgi:photosystem II stability/assembly factor-like uncharacterized protein
MINEVTQPSDAAIAHTLWVKAGILYDVWVQRADSRVVAVGAPGNTTSNDQGMFSTDGGDTWASGVTTPGTDLDFNSLSMVDSLLGYACGEDHIVYKTTDGGATWNAVTQPATSTTDLEEIFFVDANTGYTFGGTGLGYKTTDGGTSWSPLTTTMTGTIYGSYFLDDMTGFIVGASGNARKTTDGGTTFTSLVPDVSTSTIYSVWMVDNNVGYISCAAGKVRKTTDGGVTWDTVDVGNTSTTLYDIEFKNESNGMTGGSVGKTWYTNDGGTTWNFENTSMSTVYGVAIDHTSQDTSAAYVCGTNTYVMRNSHVIIPVELLTFTASVNGNSVTLSWQTATELNNSGFNVERKSGEEQNWAEVGYVQGHGTTTEIQNYSFTDKNLPVGSYYYRIKQIDFDGSYEYFILPNAVEIAAPENYDLSQNYPNPFNPTTKIKYAVPVDGLVALSVYNILGEKVADVVNSVQKAGIYEVTFDASNLASGMYIYRMQADDFVSVKKMMILK